MAEVLVEFTDTVTSEDGKNYIARACGAAMKDGMWQGWLEFLPLGKGQPVRSGRETTQPNRTDTEYWATGLTYVYLEGALRRALRPVVVRPVVRRIEPPYFDSPIETSVFRAESTESILDPFSVYRKGEALLRRQLSALAGWHLVNIIRRYELSDEDAEALKSMPPLDLVETIIDGVRHPRNAHP